VVAGRDFSGNVISAGYVGSRGDNVAFVVPNLDLAPAAPGAIQARRRYFAQLPNVTTIGLFASDFESSYDALQLVFQRRHRNGLTIGSNYVLAHSTWTQPTPSTTASNRCRRRLRHPPQDRVLGELRASVRPVADRRVEGPAGRWQVNGVAYWQSGLPFNVTNPTARSNTSARNDRPNLVGEPESNDPTVAQWFNVAAFAPQVQNTIGNAPRNVLHDASAARSLGLQGLRADGGDQAAGADRGLQHHQHGELRQPDPQLGAPGFGSINSIGNSIPRQMQFAAKLLF
jgi:hypothetical protein